MTMLGLLSIQQRPSDLPYVGQPKPQLEGLLGRESAQLPAAPKQSTSRIESTTKALMGLFGVLPSTPPEFPIYDERVLASLGLNPIIASASLPPRAEVQSVSSSGVQFEDAFRLLNSGVRLSVAHRDIHPANELQVAHIGTESPSMASLVRNARELAQFKGEWLLFKGDELILHTADFGAIRREITQRQIATPFVYYVPTDQESSSITI